MFAFTLALLLPSSPLDTPLTEVVRELRDLIALRPPVNADPTPIRTGSFFFQVTKRSVTRDATGEIQESNVNICNKEFPVKVYDLTTTTSTALPVVSGANCQTTLESLDGGDSFVARIDMGGFMYLEDRVQSSDGHNQKHMAPWMVVRLNNDHTWVQNNVVMTPTLNAKEASLVLEGQRDRYFEDAQIVGTVVMMDPNAR